jgi:hypothetical protein
MEIIFTNLKVISCNITKIKFDILQLFVQRAGRDESGISDGSNSEFLVSLDKNEQVKHNFQFLLLLGQRI